MITRSAPASRCLAVGAGVVIALGLTACGEYSPVAPERSDDPVLPGHHRPRVEYPPAPEPADDVSTPEAAPVEPEAEPVPDAGADITPPAPRPRAGGGGAGGSGGSTGSTGSGGGQSAPVSYTWSLPPTDTSVTGNDGPAYGALRSGCGAAIGFLGDEQGAYGLPFWQFLTPRYLVMYTAGLAHCVGRSDLGDAYATGAFTVYGTAAMDRIDLDPDTFAPLDPQPQPYGYGEPACDLYRTLVSIRDQVAPDAVACENGGVTPSWRAQTHGSVDVFDDPCTFDVDESAVPWPGPGDPPPSFCGPLTLERLTAAADDPAALFAGITAAQVLAAISAAAPAVETSATAIASPEVAAPAIPVVEDPAEAEAASEAEASSEVEVTPTPDAETAPETEATPDAETAPETQSTPEAEAAPEVTDDEAAEVALAQALPEIATEPIVVAESTDAAPLLDAAAEAPAVEG